MSAEITTNRLRRFLVLVAFSFWMGGFTFYAGVVIPTAHEVLGSHREVGFITQQVTRWLNLSGLVALAVLAWNAAALVKASTCKDRRWLIGTLAVMAACQLALLVEHPILDHLIDAESQSLGSHARFYGWHRVFLLTAAVQWLAAMLHLWFIKEAA